MLNGVAKVNSEQPTKCKDISLLKMSNKSTKLCKKQYDQCWKKTFLKCSTGW